MIFLDNCVVSKHLENRLSAVAYFAATVKSLLKHNDTKESIKKEQVLLAPFDRYGTTYYVAHTI